MSKNRIQAGLLLQFLAIVAGCELTIMTLLPVILPGATGGAQAVADTILLIVTAGPLLWWRFSCRRLNQRWAIGLSLASVLLAGVVMSSIHHNSMISSDAKELHLFHGKAIMLDERLTMSARLAAASGDQHWEEHYRRAEAELDVALKRTATLLETLLGARIAEAEEDVMETSRYNDALVVLENQCFERLRAGDRTGAAAAVMSAEYDRLKGLYADAVARSDAAIERLVAQEITRTQRWAVGASALLALSVSVVIGWMILAGRARQEAALAERAVAAEQAGEVLRRTVQELRTSEEAARVANEALALRKFALDQHAIVTEADAQRRITYANDQFCRLSGYSREELIGQDHHIVSSGYHPPEFWKEMYQSLARDGVWTGEVCNRAKDGHRYWLHTTNVAFKNHDRRILGYVSIRFDVTSRKAIQQTLAERAVLAQSTADIGIALTHGEDLRAMLQRCSQAMVTHLDAAFARIWTLNEATNILELQASAGMYTHIDGGHARVPVGKFKIGLIAQERKSHLTNRVVGDPRVGDQEWARREGMVAFAGYPLLIGDRVIGVMAMFARKPLSQLTTDAMASVASTVALGIERCRAQTALRERSQSLEEMNVVLTHATEAAQAANRVKSEFLANMSHEIRTPMTAILGFADSLVDESLPPQERREAVATIRRNGEHLLKIINDILDLSKIESGKLVVDLVDCPTCSILAEVQSFMTPKAASKQLALDIEFLTPIPERIRTDPIRLRQILLNLVGNSLKFTESGSVRLVLRHVSEPVSALQLDIVDTGIGMTPEEAASIFSAFQQADASTTRRFGGTGLGLTISKRLANLLGGDVVLLETGPGLGTRFRATIPTGPLDGVTMLTNPRDAVGVQTHLPEPLPATCLPLRGRILLAEDGADNQRLIALIVRKAGAELTIVENGKLAVDRIVTAADAGKPFALVLMDMQMPVMDGYAATRALREAGCSLPIIALTAHAMQGEREKCLTAGCDEYVTKPIQRAELIETIRRHLDAAACSARLVKGVLAS